MKAYTELSPEVQKKAIQYFLYKNLKAVVDGRLRFEDADISKRLVKAWKKAEDLQTVWFIGECIMEDQILADFFNEMARVAAISALYVEGEEEPIVRLSDLV